MKGKKLERETSFELATSNNIRLGILTIKKN
jgi:hypothetical protein